MTNCKIDGFIQDQRKLSYKGQEFLAEEISFSVEGWLDCYGEEINELDYDTMTITDFIFSIDDQWQDTKEWDMSEVELLSDEDLDQFLSDEFEVLECSDWDM